VDSIVGLCRDPPCHTQRYINVPSLQPSTNTVLVEVGKKKIVLCDSLDWKDEVAGKVESVSELRANLLKEGRELLIEAFRLALVLAVGDVYAEVLFC